MSWTGSLFIALAIAVASALYGGVLAGLAARWLRVSTREGYAGYWTVFMALLAGVFGLVAALLVLRLGAFESGTSAALAAAGVALGGVTLPGVLAWLGRERGGGRLPTLDLELRGPPGGATLAGDEQVLRARVTAKRAAGEAVRFDRAALRLEAGRWLLPGVVALRTRRPGRYMTLSGTRLNNAKAYFYLGPEVVDPLAPGTWSAWLGATPSGNLQPENDGAAFELRIRPRP